jgi:hypothetical protein
MVVVRFDHTAEFYQIIDGIDLAMVYRLYFSPEDRVSEDYFFPEAIFPIGKHSIGIRVSNS